MENKLDGFIVKLCNIDFEKDKLNKLLCLIYVVIITVILPIMPLGKGIGLYTFKTSAYIFTTILTLVGYICINYGTKVEKVSVYTYMFAIYAMLLIISTIVSKFGLAAITGANARGERFSYNALLYYYIYNNFKKF